MRRLLERLGLHRPELRAWALYDWANSAFVCTVITAVFPVYFAKVAAKGLAPAEATGRFALVTTLGLAAIAVASPLLGALADAAGGKKRLLAGFVVAGSLATAGLFLVGEGDWALGAALFVVGNVALNGSFVFYDALLPHVARPDEVDRVSTAGYALGYLGGGLLLALNLAMILSPATFGLPHGPGLTSAQATLPSRLAFLSVAAWWLLFTIPLLRRVPEPPRTSAPGAGGAAAIRGALASLRATFRELGRYREAALLLAAYLVYNDGIGTIIRLATVYGAEVGLGEGTLIGAIVMVQFVGIPFAFLFGALAGRVGAKRAVLLGLAAYAVIALLAARMRTATDFWVLALLVAMVQGGTQALSRSLFASMIPAARSGEFFGFFAVMDKAAGILGPAVFAAASLLLGSSRLSILAVLAFFVVGALLLARVDVEAGRRAAAAADRGTPAER